MAENIDNEKKNTEENKDAQQEPSAEKTVSSSGQSDKTQELTSVDNTAKSQEKAESAEKKPEEHTEKDEEKKEASAAPEEKTENTAEKKTAGETASAPKTEAPKPAKPVKKKGSHKKVWTVVGICALCFACGFGGGVVANYTGLGSRKNDTSAEREEMEKFFEQLPSQFDNNGSQGSNGSGSSGSDGSDGSSSASPSQGTQNGSGSSDSANPFAAKAALGITVQQVTASDDQEGGVYVAAIADESNAADAGVKVGDRIVKVDNTEVTSVSTLAEYIASKDVGDKVTLTLKRDDQEITAEVTLISKNSVSSSDNEKA